MEYMKSKFSVDSEIIDDGIFVETGMFTLFATDHFKDFEGGGALLFLRFQF